MIFFLTLQYYSDVRIFSAQNDANFRKEKIQSLKLRGDKQTGAGVAIAAQRQHQRINEQMLNRSNTSILAASSPNGQLLEQTTRIDRLLKEIDALRETNKSLAEKVQVRKYCRFFFLFGFFSR